MRADEDGNLDTGFNAAGTIPGVLTYHNAAGGDLSDQAHAVTVDGNGKIVVVGNSTNSNGNPDMTIWRFNP